MQGIESEKFDPIHNETDQIFTFLIAEKLPSLEIISQTLFEICGENKSLYPNLFISLDGSVITYANNRVQRSAIDANKLVQIRIQSPLSFFIEILCNFMHTARTVKLNHWKYVKTQFESFDIEKQIELKQNALVFERSEQN